MDWVSRWEPSTPKGPKPRWLRVGRFAILVDLSVAVAMLAARWV